MQLLIVFFKGDGFCRAGHLAGAAEPAVTADDHLVVFYDWHAKGAGVYTLAAAHTLLVIYFHDRHDTFLLTLKHIHYRPASCMRQCCSFVVEFFCSLR